MPVQLLRQHLIAEMSQAWQLALYGMLRHLHMLRSARACLVSSSDSTCLQG